MKNGECTVSEDWLAGWLYCAAVGAGLESLSRSKDFKAIDGDVYFLRLIGNMDF